jgi:uronate dehydrogenase
VVTGASGHVGKLTSRALAGRYRLRLVDLDWTGMDEREAGDDVERLTLDLTETGSWDTALRSADFVVHLAGHPYPGIDARTAVEGGAMLAAGLAAAASNSSQVKRIVFASSIHTMGLYHRWGHYPIRQQWQPRPCCEYGAAKVFSENILELLTERTPISVVCLRLGLTGFPATTPNFASQWLGPEDYARLLHASLTAGIKYGAYFGLSLGAADRWDLSETIRDLGFESTDAAPLTDPGSNHGPEPAAEHCLMFSRKPTPREYAPHENPAED